MPASGPSLVRRQLGRRLRRLREDAGKTEQDVQDARLVSRVKLWRIETGKVSVKVPDVWALCRFYGADDETIEMLSNLAVATTGEGWWEEHNGVVPEWFKLRVGMESAASKIQLYEGVLVPGLLQTEDYARAVYQAAQPEADEDAILRQVSVRMERQTALFGQTERPALQVVLDEGVLRRQVGGSEVMAAQVARLREADSTELAEIRILREVDGAHAAMTGAFAIFEFDDDEDPDVAYFEAQVGAHYLEKPAELAEYRRIFELIYKQAVPIKEIP